MSQIDHNSERHDVVAKAMAELERLLVGMAKPSDFGSVRLEVVIHGGRIVQLKPATERSIKLTA